MLTKKLLFPAAFALAAIFLAGCETTAMQDAAMEEPMDSLADVRAIAEEALRTANTAAYNAATAKDMAISAQDAAGMVHEAADMAQESANMAQACCDANARRMNIMEYEAMKKAMHSK